jgi:hypothetical protein
MENPQLANISEIVQLHLLVKRIVMYIFKEILTEIVDNISGFIFELIMFF